MIRVDSRLLGLGWGARERLGDCGRDDIHAKGEKAAWLGTVAWGMGMFSWVREGRSLGQREGDTRGGG